MIRDEVQSVGAVKAIQKDRDSIVRFEKRFQIDTNKVRKSEKQRERERERKSQKVINIVRVRESQR